MTPFGALGEAMQTVGLWLLNLPCRVFGHRWEAQYIDYAEGNYIDGWLCRRCWKMDYR